MVKIVYEPEKNRSAAYDDGKEIGESTFSVMKNVWFLNHTYVKRVYEGQGIGGKLVLELVNQARKENVKIMPVCSFVKKEFDEKPEYSDVLTN